MQLVIQLDFLLDSKMLLDLLLLLLIHYYISEHDHPFFLDEQLHPQGRANKIHGGIDYMSSNYIRMSFQSQTCTLDKVLSLHLSIKHSAQLLCLILPRRLLAISRGDRTILEDAELLSNRNKI